MKDFDLKLAKQGDGVETNEGDQVIELTVLSSEVDEPVIVVVRKTDEEEEYLCTMSFTEEGRSFDDSSDIYLVMAPKFVTYWSNVYKLDNGKISMSDVYKDKKSATDRLNPNRVRSSGKYLKTISFEVEEWDLLNLMMKL